MWTLLKPIFLALLAGGMLWAMALSRSTAAPSLEERRKEAQQVLGRHGRARSVRAMAFTPRTGFDGKTTGWTLKQEQGKAVEFVPWSEKRVHTALADWRGNFEGLTHRLAKRDPDVRAI